MGESTDRASERQVLAMKRWNLLVVPGLLLGLFWIPLAIWLIADASSLARENGGGVAAPRRDGIIVLLVAGVFVAFALYQMLRPRPLTIDPDGFTVSLVFQGNRRRGGVGRVGPDTHGRFLGEVLPIAW